MPGGSTPQQQTSTTNQSQNTSSTTGANPYIVPALQGGVNQLEGYYQNNPTAPSYYPGGTYAGLSPQTDSAIQTLFGYGANGGSGGAQLGENYANGVLSPGYTNVANDPYFQSSLQAGFQPQNLNFQETTLPSVRSQFEGSGRNLGGADMDQTQLALTNFEQGQSNAAAQATQQQYQANQQNQLNVLSQLPSIQNMGYQNIGAMGAAGQALDQNNQNYLNSNVAAYNYNNTAQPNYLSDFLSRIQAGYPGGQTTGTGQSSGYSTGTATPASNSTSSFLGGGLGLAGLGLQAAGLFSDARLKEDITPVGKLDDGQNVYSYRYKGSPTTQIGLMAQEVEKIHPEAVHVDPATGFKKVRYDLAMPVGGLF